MTLTDRDRRILILLPASLVVLGYSIWFATTGKYQSLTQARAATEKALSNVPSENKLRTAQYEYAVAANETAQATKDASDARNWLVGHLACVDPKSRADRLHRLASLLAKHNLTLMTQQEVSQDDPIPPSVEALRKALPDSNKNGLHLHKIRFAARYEDVMSATIALASDGSMVIPVSLTMKASPNFSAWHEWSMLVWV